MPNLHQLSLSNVFIDVHLLKTICKLKGLRFLGLTNIEFSPNVAERVLKKTPSITSLQLDWSSSSNAGEENLDSTVARVVNVANLQKLSAARCAQVMPILPQTPTLVELSLKLVESTDDLWNTIGSLRALTTLEMMSVTVRRATAPHQLTTSSLPSLRRLIAPPSFSSIVVNRPLSYINLIDGIQSDETKQSTHLSSQISEISESFTRSSADPTSLLIPFEFYSIVPFCEKFPDLQNLTIMNGHPNFTFSSDQPNDYDGCCPFKSVSCY
ncbi:hypothetical protein C0995_007261 [Termitomyces sp. Mi166|nr:hypothetical protein C0995_007261 [Termitomyces sp. Mi166\